jgi:sec-independent protein translocase protein TatB
LKEAELDDVKNSIDSLRGLNPLNEVRKQLNPFEQAAADVRAGVDTMMKPKPAADPAAPAAETPQAAEPLKNGATDMPGVNATEATPAAPIFPAMTDASVTAPVSETPAPAKPAKNAAKARTAGIAAKTPVASKAPAAKAPAKSSPAPAKAAAVAKAAPKGEAKPAAAKKPAAKKATDTKKTAGAAK